LFGGSGQDPEKVGQPVQVRYDPIVRDRIDAPERDGAAFGPADDRSGQLEERREAGLARNHEFARQLDGRLGLGQHGVEAADHIGRDSRLARLLPPGRPRGGGKIGPGHEELALKSQDQIREPVEDSWDRSDLRHQAQFGAGEAEGRDGLVDGTEGLGAGVVLGHSVPAEEKPGRAVVAASGGNR